MKMSIVRQWPSADISIEEVEFGVNVTQKGRTYLAKKWGLTNKVCEYIDLALHHNLACTYQKGHPHEKNFNTHPDGGVQYIAFSRRWEEKWVMSIDQYSGRPDIKQVTFEKSYHQAIKLSQSHWVWETHGGKNIFVPYEEVPEILTLITSDVIDDVEHGRLGRDRTRERVQRTNIITENDLQQAIVEAVQDRSLEQFFGKITHHREKPQFQADEDNRFTLGSLGQARTRLIPDLILVGKSDFTILELKKGSASLPEIQQLLSYGDCKDAKKWANGKHIHCALVAERFTDSAIKGAAEFDDPSFSLALYQFSFDKALTLAQVTQKQ